MPLVTLRCTHGISAVGGLALLGSRTRAGPSWRGPVAVTVLVGSLFGPCPARPALWPRASYASPWPVRLPSPVPHHGGQPPRPPAGHRPCTRSLAPLSFLSGRGAGRIMGASPHGPRQRMGAGPHPAPSVAGPGLRHGGAAPTAPASAWALDPTPLLASQGRGFELDHSFSASPFGQFQCLISGHQHHAARVHGAFWGRGEAEVPLKQR